MAGKEERKWARPFEGGNLKELNYYSPEDLGYMLEVLDNTAKSFQAKLLGRENYWYSSPIIVGSYGQEFPESEATKADMVIQQAITLAQYAISMRIARAESFQAVKQLVGEIDPERLAESLAGLQTKGMVFAALDEVESERAEATLWVDLPLATDNRQVMQVKFGKGRSGFLYPLNVKVWEWSRGGESPTDLGSYTLIAEAIFPIPRVIQEQEPNDAS